MDDKEFALLRELAAGQCVIPKVVAELGPLSLWSKDAFDREMAKARAAALEEAAKVCDEAAYNERPASPQHAAAIRALKG